MKITIEGYEDEPTVIESDQIILFVTNGENEENITRIIKCNLMFMGYVAKVTESIFLGAEHEQTGNTFWGKVAKKLGLKD